MENIADGNFRKSSSYYTRNRQTMLDFIPQTVSRVLEIGCGVGNFASLLKERNKVEVWGVELNKDAAKEAERKLDKVIVANFENDVIDIPKNFFDCIVFNDVLEHLINPWNVLTISKMYLSKEGYIVASIPNVRYFMNIKRLLKHKEWNYENDGVLDNTHLRFFTIKSIIAMFQNAGFEIVKIEGINSMQFPWKFRILNLMLMRIFDDMRYQQFACVAKVKS